MCDETTFAEWSKVSRREFGALTLAAAVALSMPRAANALDVTGVQVDVSTPDGVDDCWLAHPTTGKHPAVIVWPDARGQREVYRQIAARLAEHGYSVLVHNPYYRGKRVPVLPEGADARDPATTAVLRPLLAQINKATDVADAKALMAFLDAHPSVDTSRKAGTLGMCLGGPITIRTAAAFPERIGAAASFHGVRLVTDEDDSPHRLVAGTHAQYVIAIAEDDDQREPAAKDELRKAFDAAQLTADVEVYAGAMHSWTTADSPVHNPEQAERAWSKMIAAFAAGLA